MKITTWSFLSICLLIDIYLCFIILAEGMLGSRDCFRGGRLDRDALVGFIKDIKKNTKLSDEDAAVMAASKVTNTRN